MQGAIAESDSEAHRSRAMRLMLFGTSYGCWFIHRDESASFFTGAYERRCGGVKPRSARAAW